MDCFQLTWNELLPHLFGFENGKPRNRKSPLCGHQGDTTDHNTFDIVIDTKNVYHKNKISLDRLNRVLPHSSFINSVMISGDNIDKCGIESFRVSFNGYDSCEYGSSLLKEWIDQDGYINLFKNLCDYDHPLPVHNFEAIQCFFTVNSEHSTGKILISINYTHQKINRVHPDQIFMTPLKIPIEKTFTDYSQCPVHSQNNSKFAITDPLPTTRPITLITTPILESIKEVEVYVNDRLVCPMIRENNIFKANFGDNVLVCGIGQAIKLKIIPSDMIEIGDIIENHTVYHYKEYFKEAEPTL